MNSQPCSRALVRSALASRRRLTLVGTGAAFFIAAGFAYAQAPAADPVLAKVNGTEIRKSDVALAEEELGPSLAQMDPAAKDDNVLSFLIDMKLVGNAFGVRDPYLFLLDPANQVVAQDDDSGGGLDAQIFYRPTVTGEYTIQAANLDLSPLPLAGMQFRLTIRRE